MWLKRKHYAINLDKLTWLGVKEREYERWCLSLVYEDDSERIIDFDSKNKAEEAFDVIIHALSAEVCYLDESDGE